MEPVEQIKDRLSIEDVVSSYIKLESAGKNLKAKSPFSNEKTPSFYVSPDKGLYHCFSTGKGGDMFTFVQEMEGVDFKGALKILAEKAGVTLGSFKKGKDDNRDALYDVMEEATKFFENSLKSSGDAMSYLQKRGVNEQSIKIFRIGYAKEGWRNLYDHLKQKFSDEIILKAGLGKKSDPSTSSGQARIYDTFRDRIMFPICDTAGRTIAFSGRLLHDDGKSAKYVNSPDTPLFKKTDTLFSLDKAKNSIRKNDFTIMVEGQFDVLMLHQIGFRNTVGVSGTALSEKTVTEEDKTNNLGLVKRLSNNIILAFDSDKAGINAAVRSAGIALSLGMDVKTVAVPGSKDPADYVLEHGKDGWASLVKNAKHIIEFLAEKQKEISKDQRDLARKIREEVLPMIARLESNMEKSFFVRKISNISGIDEDVIWSDLQNVKIDKQESLISSVNHQKERLSKKDDIERKMMGLYMGEPTETIRKQIIECMGQEKIDNLSHKFSSFKDEIVLESEIFFQNADKTAMTKDMLLNLEESYLKEEIHNLKSQIKNAENLGLEEEAEKLTQDYQTAANKLAEIKNSRHINKY